MKIKHLLLGMLAMAAAVACKQEEPVQEPKLDVDKTAVALEATAGEATFAVTSTQNWVATADADWVSMDPASGAASQEAVTVKVTADDNTTTEARTATVTVKAGALTKTVAVTQAAGAGETPGPGDEPELQKSEWALVGSFGEWNPESDLYLSVLDENYFVYYGMELASDAEFKFLKGGAWPPAGTEIGGNGLVEPNTIQPAGGSNIKVTEAGKYDIYLAADLTKFYIMSEGKLPAEAVEPAPVENQWGMMGCFVDNQWATDVPMTKEGEWIVAKGAQFTELTFKIRANKSWADATNIGLAPGSERGYVNGKVSVVTAEYAKANLGGDAADIKLDGEAGTYDVYFSFEKLEVYVMEQGAKPGEKDPIVPEVPVEITYTVVGTLKDLNWQNGAPEGLMVKEGDYYVGKNIPLVTAKTLYDGADQIEFKVVETGTWTGYGHASKENENFINGEIPVSLGGENIIVKGAEGAYDVYLDKANLKVWVMEAGFKPGEKEPVIPQPEPTASTIASVLALGKDATVPADTFVEGVVISNMDLNNLTSKKGMYIQDETAGLQFYLAANHTFKFGDKVKVDLSGAKVGAYNGAVQISGLALSKIEVLSSGNAVEPKTVTIADFLANKYEGQYVAIENVQVADADLSKTFVMGGAHTSIKIENADGNSFVVFSSKYATYGTTAVPQGSGTLKGISSINNGNMQLIFAQNSDYAGLTGERFGQGTVEPEPEQPETPQTPVAANRADFETFPENFGQYSKEFTSAAGWHTVNCAIQEGYTTDINPQFICIGTVPGTEQWAKAVCINGKVGASGVLTSPEIAGGCGTLSFNYGNMFTDKNGVSFQVEVIQNGEVVKTLTFTKDAASVAQKTKYEGSLEVNVSGSFSLKFTNLSPSNSTSSNKDRVSLWNMTWTSFE